MVADPTAGSFSKVDGNSTANAASHQKTSGSDKLIQSKHYCDEDADITIISSDNVAFKVHSYRLQAASAVFRGLIAVAGQPATEAQQSVIHLNDTVLERSRILRTVFDLLDSNMIKCLEDCTFYDLLNITAFAKKYEMPLITQLLRLDGYTWRLESDPGWHLPTRLRCAWELKDPRLLKDVLATGWDVQQVSDKSKLFSSTQRRNHACDDFYPKLSDVTKVKTRCNDPLELAYEDVLHLPNSLVWIMLQATRVAKKTGQAPNGKAYQTAYMNEAGRLFDLAFPDDPDDKNDHDRSPVDTDWDSEEGDDDDDYQREAKRVRR